MAVDKEEYLRKFRTEVAMFVRYVLIKAGSPRIPVDTMKRGFEKFYLRTLEQDLALGEVEEAVFLAAYPQFWRAIERDGTTWLEFVPPSNGELRRPKEEPVDGEEQQEDAEAAAEAPAFWSGEEDEAEVGERPSFTSTKAGGFGGSGVVVKEERHAPATPQAPSGASAAASAAIAPPDPDEFVGFSSSESEDEEADDERVDNEEEDLRLDVPRTPPAAPPVDEELERMRREVQATIETAARIRRVTQENAARFNETNRFGQQKVRELEAERDRLAAQNAELQQQLGAASTKLTVQRNEMASMQSLIADLKHHFALLLPGLEQEVARVRTVLDAVAEPQAE